MKLINPLKKNGESEKGNVLFLILIAVILFAALSYAVTSSSRSGGSGDTASETNLVNSAQITQYPASVRTAIIRMLVSGRLVDDLVFDRPDNFNNGAGSVEVDGVQANAVFHPRGGAATSVLAPAAVMEDGALGDWFFSVDYQIQNIGTTDAGGSADANDLIAFLPGVSRAVCLSLNRELGITATTDADADGIPDGATTVPTDDKDIANNTWPPTAAATGTHYIQNDFNAQPFGCYDSVPGTGNAANQNIYYHVLIER